MRVRLPCPAAAGLFALAFRPCAAAPDTPCMPHPIEDPAVLEAAGLTPPQRAEGESERYRVRSGPPRILVVIRDGTQVAELDSAATARFLSEHPGFLTDGTAGETPRRGGRAAVAAARLWGDQSFVATLLDRNSGRKGKLRAILELGQWPVGLTVGDAFEAGASTLVVYRNTFHCTGLAKVSFAYLGAGYDGTSLCGSMARRMLDDSASWYQNHSFSLTVGLPFVRYELRRAGWIVPEYFWLENDLAAVMDSTEQGSTVVSAQWRWNRAHANNVCHYLRFRLGHLSWDLLFDSDIYGGVIASVNIEQIPSIVGTWGASLTKARDVWVPGVWLELPRISRDLFSLGAYRFPLVIEPLRMHFHYWDLRRYNVACETRAHLRYRTTVRSDHGQ
jgi:hypothetical protein